MKLTAVQVRNYKSIEDSGVVEIDPEVTCLVGKNESGKTAFEHALGHLNPVESQPADFDYELDYPRKDLNTYKRRHARQPAPVVTATFELTGEEVAAVEADFGKGCLTDNTFTVTKYYSNRKTFTIPYDEAVVVQHLVAETELPKEHARALAKHQTTTDLLEAA